MLGRGRKGQNGPREREEGGGWVPGVRRRGAFGWRLARGTPGDGGSASQMEGQWTTRRGLSQEQGRSGSRCTKHLPGKGSGLQGLQPADERRAVFSPPPHPGAAAEAGVAAGLPGEKATGLCPQAWQCHHLGDLLPPLSPSSTRLNVLPLFLAQRQRTPLFPLPGAGPYARPAGGTPAATPRLGQGHLRSLPERDGCFGGTDKAGR